MLLQIAAISALAAFVAGGFVWFSWELVRYRRANRARQPLEDKQEADAEALLAQARDRK